MCFSASASFSSGVILSVIGVISLKKVQQPSQIPFASIPLIFAFQQITEGFVWLSLSDPTYAALQTATTYIFLFIAQIIWPIWVPYSILMLEKKESRKTAGKILLGVGSVVALGLGYCLLTLHVEAKTAGQHISYIQNYPSTPRHIGAILYIIATIVPPFFSPVKKMWSLGAAILISYIITQLFYNDYIVSVWCFFAAVISITVFLVMQEVTKTEVKEAPAQVLTS